MFIFHLVISSIKSFLEFLFYSNSRLKIISIKVSYYFFKWKVFMSNLKKKKINIKFILILFCRFSLIDLICLLLLLLSTCGSIRFPTRQSHTFLSPQSFSTNIQPIIHLKPYRTPWKVPEFHLPNFTSVPNKSQVFYCTFMFPLTNIVISSNFPAFLLFHC